MANRNNEWAENEFGDAVLGDKRLTDRLVNIADSFTSYNAPICLDHFFQSDPIFKMNMLINTSTHI